MSNVQTITSEFRTVLDEIVEMACMITGIEVEEMKTDSELFAFGFDSMLLMVLGKQINSKYQLEITLDLLVTSLNTLEKLAEFVVSNRKNETILNQERPEINTETDTNGIESNIINYITEDEKEEKSEVSLMDINVIKNIFDNQLSVMQEQNRILQHFMDGTKKEPAIQKNINNVPINCDNDKKSANQHQSEKQLSNYYTPYKRLNFNETSQLNELQSKYKNFIEQECNTITHGSKEATDNHRKVHAEWRNITGFRPSFKELIYPIYAAKGKGSKIIDIDGNEFLDMTMGFGVNLFGNNPDFIKKALQKALDSDGTPLGPLEVLPGEVASKISELTGVERVYFCNTGTEADMVAVRLARAVTGKDKVVCFKGSYHGNNDGLLGISVANNKDIETLPMAPGITKNTVRDLILLEYGSPESIKYIKEHGDTIAAVLAETVQSRRPDIQPRDFLHELRKITEQLNIALIFDEVITGFRIGIGGAQEYFDVKADIVTYGKIIGGGMPIGVVAGSAKYLDSIDGGIWNYGDDSLPPNEDKRTFVGGTFCHHHLTMVAAKTVLDYIKENKEIIYPDLNEKTEKLSIRINNFFQKNDINLHMSTFGSLFRFNITPNIEIFYYGLIQKGIYIWEGRNFFLSTEHTQEDINKLYKAVTETALEMKKAGYFGNQSEIEKQKIIETKEENKIIPMSLIQQRLYSHIIIENSDPFDLVGASIINGNLDLEILENAINECIANHESFRTSFHLENGEFLQSIQQTANIKVKVFCQEDTDDLDAYINRCLMKFDLTIAPLLEVLLLNTFDNKKVLVFHSHHTVADGVSMGLLVNEVARICNNEEVLKEKKPYSDFVDWELGYLKSDQMSVDRSFFLERLSDCIYSIPLPYDNKNKADAGFEGRILYDFFSPDLTECLKETAKHYNVSLFMLLLSGWYILLHQISQEEHIAVTTPVSCRFDGGFEESIGMFTNTLVLESKYDEDMQIKDYLHNIKRACMSSYGHINYPYNLLTKELHATGENSFNVMFGYENAETRLPDIHGVELNTVEFAPNVQEFDVSFDLQEKNGGIEVNFSYRKDLFSNEIMDLMIERYRLVIEQIIKKQLITLSEINILTDKEYNLILNNFNNTTVEYSNEKTIVDLFEDQVRKTPNNIAIIYNDRTLTYKELNAKANQVAHKLIELGAGIEDAICLMSERSLETIICIHGILKAGCAYMPVDTRYPKERIKFMIDDCKPKVILVGNMTVPNGVDANIINILDEGLYTGDAANLEVKIHPENLVHLMYTSGTTGMPKGVMSTHTGLVNRIEWMQKMYPMYENDTILQKTTYTFDDSVYEILWSNLVGARLAILKPGGELEVDVMTNAIKNYQVTHMLFVPTVLKELLRYTGSKHLANEYLGSLRLVVSSGEALTSDLVSLFRQTLPDSGCVLANLYGPTEVSIDSTYYNCTMEEDGCIPIGKPIDNTTTYIVNSNKLCGIGVPGELYIGGVGVARGYLNRPELTKERFIDNPYGLGMLYCSGDMTRWLPDGNIEYLGRMDDQVKIRGQRIELGEIENAIRKVENIKDAVLITKSQSGEKEIYAYLISDVQLDIKNIREELRGMLPEYMIPPYMMQINEIPLNTNGKVNKRALPAIEVRSMNEYIPPRNEVDRIICEIFSKVLGAKNIGINDSFMELGGDSIKAIKIVSKLREAGYEILIKELLENHSVSCISDKAVVIQFNDYNQEEVTGKIKNTPILKEFSEMNLVKPYHYNQAILIPTDIQKEEVITEALSIVIKHHDVLRAVYRNGELIILDSTESLLFDFEIIDLDEANSQMEDECDRLQQSIDLEKGPLVKAALFKGCLNNYIFICIHHLVVDSVSFGIIGEDLKTVLTQLESREDINLPKKTASYIDWAEALEEYGHTYVIESETGYWKRVSLKARNAGLRTSVTDADNSNNRLYEEIIMELSTQMTNNLLYQSGKAFNTDTNDILLGALGRAVRQFTGQENVIVWLEGHGREQLHKKIDVTRTVGWFTNIYPLVLPCETDLENSIIHTKEKRKKVPNNGIGYGVLGIEFNIPKDICFNYLGTLEGDNGQEILVHNIGRSIAMENSYTHSINIEAYALAAGMKISLLYDTNKYQPDDMKMLLNLYINSIQDLTEFCCGRDYTKKTLSDYGAVDLDEIELDEIKALLE